MEFQVVSLLFPLLRICTDLAEQLSEFKQLERLVADITQVQGSL
jgi:hypothetical protein